MSTTWSRGGTTIVFLAALLLLVLLTMKLPEGTDRATSGAGSQPRGGQAAVAR